MTRQPIHLRPEPTGDDPARITWRVGPGLVRVSREVAADSAPDAIARLLVDGVLSAVTVAPGRIDTRLAPGRTANDDGRAVRTALFEVLAGPQGWPDGTETGSDGIAEAADREIARAVDDVLHGEFGAYTSSHGGEISLIGVTDGQVRVRLSGQCHGCTFADNTVRNNLAARLAPIPGFRGVRILADGEGAPVPRTARSRAARPPLLRRLTTRAPRGPYGS